MNRILLSALAALILFSCSKNDDPDPEPWPPEGDYNQFQLHCFVPGIGKNTVVADSMFVNDVLYATNKQGGQFISYSGLPSMALSPDGSVQPRFFIGYNNMNILLYKDKNIVYEQQVGNLQTGGSYHLVVYDLKKEPAIFNKISLIEEYKPTLRIKFANFLFQNPETKYPGTVRLQYSHQDEEDWQTVGSAVRFGEATDDFNITITDEYQALLFRVVDQNGTILSSDGKTIEWKIVPGFVTGTHFSVFFLGGSIEGGQPAELFQWKSM